MKVLAVLTALFIAFGGGDYVDVGGSICVVDGIICAPQEFVPVTVVVDGEMYHTVTGLYGGFYIPGVKNGKAHVHAVSEKGYPLLCHPGETEVRGDYTSLTMMCFEMDEWIYLPLVVK